MSQPKTASNQSSDKLLSVFELLVAQSEPVRLNDLARLADMNASTVLRFLLALQKRGYVAQDADSGRYYATLKVCALAESVLASNSVRGVALPFMRNLAALFNESCNLAVERDMTAMYIQIIKAPNNLLLSTQRIGNSAPLYCTGVGKLFLTDYTSADLERYLAFHPLKPFTENTIVTAEGLRAEIERARELGYAFDNEECDVGVRCIAVPIRDYTGKVHAAVSISGPVFRMTDQHIHGRLPAMTDAAQQLSMLMGWQPH